MSSSGHEPARLRETSYHGLRPRVTLDANLRGGGKDAEFGVPLGLL